MSEELQMKHIAPYLPYGVKAGSNITEPSSWLGEVAGIAEYNEEHFKVMMKDYPSDYMLNCYCVLVLHPLSDLGKEFEHNGETISAAGEIYNRSWMACGYTLLAGNLGYEIKCNEDGSSIMLYDDKLHVSMHWVFEVLLELHFDVFGLIEKGQAIDINTLK